MDEEVRMAAMKKELFEASIREYTPYMYRLAYGIVQNHEDAEDAVGETVLKAYEKLHTLRRPEAFRAWLMQITANEAKKIYSRNKRRTPVEDLEPYLPVFQDEHHELWDVVMELDIGYRETILLYFYEQFTIPEIAKVLHIPVGTVKSRLSRGKGLLREKLTEV